MRLPARLLFVVMVTTTFGISPLVDSARGESPEDCRSPWGSDDERGAINRITPAKTLEAAALIQQGKIYQLGRKYEKGMPLSSGRSFSLVIPQVRGPMARYKLTSTEEFVAGQIGQVGTQFDGLGHAGINGVFFNCNKAKDFVKSDGLTHLGVEHTGAFFTRGILIDVLKYKDVASLEENYEITSADLKGALAKQGVSLREGDVAIIHTGWGFHWMKNNALYLKGAPGIGLDAGRWLAAQKIVMVAADTGAVEVPRNNDLPSDEPAVHQVLLTQNGINILENLDTSELVKDKVYTFAFIFSPLKLKGATGSPGNPIAVR